MAYTNTTNNDEYTKKWIIYGKKSLLELVYLENILE